MNNSMCCCACGGFSPCALGMAFGVMSAIAVVVIGILGWQFGVGQGMITMLGSVYYGFAATPIGILIGAVWGFVVGFVYGIIIAIVYNFCVTHCPCKFCSEKRAKGTS